MAVNELSSVVAGTSSPQTSNTFTPTPGALVVAVGSVSGSGSATGNMSVSTNVPGLTLTAFKQACPGTASSAACSVFTGFASDTPGSGTVTITASASPAAMSVYVFEITNVDTSIPTAGGNTVLDSTSGTVIVTLNQAPATADTVIGVYSSRNIAAAQATPGAGFTTLVNYGGVSPDAGIFVEYRTDTTSTSVEADNLNTVSNSAVAFIAKASTGGVTTHQASAALSASSSIGAIPNLIWQAAAAFAASSVLSVSPTQTHQASAALTASAKLTADSAPIQPVVAHLVATATLSASPTQVHQAAASLRAISSMTVVPSGSILAASAALSASATLTAKAQRGVFANIFTPPTIVQRYAIDGLRYSLNIGVTVVEVSPGVFKDVRFQRGDVLESYSRYWLGGYSHVVDQETAGALTAAGYAVTSQIRYE